MDDEQNFTCLRELYAEIISNCDYLESRASDRQVCSSSRIERKGQQEVTRLDKRFQHTPKAVLRATLTINDDIVIGFCSACGDHFTAIDREGRSHPEVLLADFENHKSKAHR